MEQHFLMKKDGTTTFQLPDVWRVLKKVELKSESVKKSLEEMLIDAIESPIGCGPLAQLIKPTYKIAVIIDDHTRPTPQKEFLTFLLDYLERCGVSRNQVDVVIAGGTHRLMTEEEIESTFGQRLSKEVRFRTHDCRSSELVPVGTLQSGSEVKISPFVTRADFRIGVGSIMPHPMCGFGGGAKVVFPGVANYEAIRDHHCAFMIAKGSTLGNIKGNLFHKEICRAGRLAKLDFLINAVYNSDEKVKAVVAGDFEKAQATGAEMSLNELGVKFDELADVTIASAFPYTAGTQLSKPLIPATMVTREGGTVILYAASVHGISEPFLEAFDFAFAKAKDDRRGCVLDSLRNGKLIIQDAPLDFIGALYMTMLYQSRVKAILVSKDVEPKQAARLGFSHVSDLDTAIEMVSREIPNATVNILPVGGLVVPIVKEPISFW